MAISLKTIREETSPSFYTRGTTIYKRHKIHGFQIEEDAEDALVIIDARVEGSHNNSYAVHLKCDAAEDEILEYTCECAAFYNYGGMCKHCVAVALQYWETTSREEEMQGSLLPLLKNDIFAKTVPMKTFTTSPAISKMIYHYSMKDKAQYFQPAVNGTVELDPTLHRDAQGWGVEFRIGGENKYVLRDIQAFIHAIENCEKVVYGQKLAFIHEESAFTKDAQKMITFLEECLKEKEYMKQQSDSYYFRYAPQKPIRTLGLSTNHLVSFLQLLAGKTCKLNDYYSSVSELRIIEGDPPLEIEVSKREEGYSVLLPKVECYCGRKTMFMRLGSLVYQCSPEFNRDMGEIFTYAKRDARVNLAIAEKDMSAFCGTIYPVLQKHTYVKKDGEIEQYLPESVQINIYLDRQDEVIHCKLEGEYGEATYNLLENFQLADMYRDVAKESQAVYTAKAYFEKIDKNNELILSEKEEDKVFQFLAIGIEQLHQVGQVYVSDALKKLTITRAAQVSIGVSLRGGLLDLSIESEKLPYDELTGLLNSYRLRKKYYRLKSGEYLQLEDNSLSAISELTEGLFLKKSELQQGKFQVPKYRAFYVDQVLREEQEGIQVVRENSFKSLIRDMRSVEDSDYEVPKPFKSVLRNYQKTGYRWLCTLDSMGFGGILADDMGLGKTIQVIAFLYGKKQAAATHLTSLIICPASLVYNWENEIIRFAPNLQVQVLTGNIEERKQKIRSKQEFDIWITSYDLLKRDIEEYENLEFFSEIIDEAQNIKNHNTQAARAVKRIHASVKFALTGTPIENRLSELWSIFDYLMPGMLGHYEKFKKTYEIPIVANADELIMKRFQRMIKPFVLRRLKKDVLKDLPDKVENVVYSKLEGEQLSLYSANVQKVLGGLKKQSKEEVNTGKLQILAELTRLRQLCCDPSLLYENYKGDSAKLETCMELIRNAMEGGHKILLFSQFTSMLSIIEKRLRKEKIASYSLTGATSKEKRAELVEEFNKNDIPVFLISLKAGGTGLNLTAATIVIHFDPWWNIAAQNQATDRTHRIGQKDVVTVFKLIAKHTIEEKILKLQEEKQNLSEQIISKEGVSVSSLTKEDFLGLLEQE